MPWTSTTGFALPALQPAVLQTVDLAAVLADVATRRAHAGIPRARCADGWSASLL